MNDIQIHPIAASMKAKDLELERQFQKIEKRDWWLWGYSILVVLLLAFAVIAICLPVVRHGADTVFKSIKFEVVFGLIVLVVLFNVYAVSQAILIKRLRRQLAEKEGHSTLLRNLAMVDPLTGLYNRRFAEQRLVAEVARSERKGHPLTILTLDLNSFKHINDTYGHPAGDQVLQDSALKKRLERIAHEFSEILDMHDVVLKRVRDRMYLSCHCTMSDELPLSRVHDVSTALETRFKQEAPELFKVLIHPEPQTDNRR